jgi:hypothetical protein
MNSFDLLTANETVHESEVCIFSFCVISNVAVKL